MTFEEKEKKILENRGTSLLGYSGALKSKSDMQNERNLNNTYLFGDGNNLGIVNIFELYYKELNILVGRTTSSPAMHEGLGSSENSWKNRFELAVSKGGDGSLYEDIDPEDGIGDQDINEESEWLTTNGDGGETSNGIKLNSTELINNVIGSPADGSTDKTTPDYGVGLIGQRTADNEEIVNPNYIDEIETPEEPEFYYGNGTPDNPDYFNETERGDLLTSLSGLISDLENCISHLEVISEELEKINNGSNELFVKPDMDFETSSKKTATDTRISNLEDIKNGLQSELDYFSGFTASDDISGQAGYDKTVFDNKLETILPGYITNLINEIDERVVEVENHISLNDTASGIRKWLVFWVKENILKPDAPYVGLNGIENAISQSIAGIKKANQSLITLYGNNTNKWIARPNNAYAYQNNILDEETGEIIKRINDFGWVGPVYVNKVEIYRKEISSGIMPDNTNWGSEDLYDTLTSFDPEVGIIKQIYSDDDASFDQGQIYMYRAQVYDTNSGVERSRLDPNNNSSSLQSEIYDEENSFPFSSITNGIFTFTDPDDLSDFSANSFIAITGTNSSDGFYRIESISRKKITLYDKSVNDNSGYVSKTFGIVYLDL